MHITIAGFTITPNPTELESQLNPYLYDNAPYLDCRPTRAQLEAWGILAPDEPWEEENDSKIDSWDVEKAPVPASEVPKEAVPYAFVTLDGVWESNEAFPSAEAWTAYWEAALARNTKAYVTYCDCHV